MSKNKIKRAILTSTIGLMACMSWNNYSCDYLRNDYSFREHSLKVHKRTKPQKKKRKGGKRR